MDNLTRGEFGWRCPECDTYVWVEMDHGESYFGHRKYCSLYNLGYWEQHLRDLEDQAAVLRERMATRPLQKPHGVH